MNKNIIIGIIVLLVIGLGYHSFFDEEKNLLSKDVAKNPTENKIDNYFAQNQDCLKYNGEIENKLEAKESSLIGESSLEQIFYSPKQNSCLYVRYENFGFDSKNSWRFYARSLYDVLDDGYSSRPIEQCIVIENGEDCIEFEAKLTEYKHNN